MNPLLRRLASLRRWTRLLDGWRGICSVALLLVGVGTLTGLLDWAIQLPALVRAVVLFATLGGAGVLAYQYLVLPFSRPCDDLSLALRVEEHHPELNDALASTVQFLQKQGSATESASMREMAIRQTSERAAQIDFRGILDTRGLYLLTAGVAVVAVIAFALAWNFEENAYTAFWRLAEPFGRHTWTRISVQVDKERRARPGDQESALRVAVGQPFVVRGRVDGIVPVQGKIEIEGQALIEKPVVIKRDSDSPAGSFVAPLDMTQQRGKFRFRVFAGDGRYPPRPGSWQEVEVLPPPKLANLDGQPSPQIELLYPRYTDLPPRRLPPGKHPIEMWAGTTVRLRAAADRPLSEAWIEYRPENPLVTHAALLAGLGQTQPLPLTTTLAVTQGAVGLVPAKFDDPERVTFSALFQPWISGTYTLFLQDEVGLAWRYHSDLHVLPDPLPIVKLHRPAVNSLTVLPDAEVSFNFHVEDETFAVRSVFAEYRTKMSAGQPAEDSRPQRLTLYDGPAFDTALPRLLARFTPLPAPGPALRLRPGQLEFATRWPLRNRFKEGETIAVQLCADDFCDIYGRREPGRSHEIELHIVGKFELARNVDDKLAEVQQQLKRLQKMQEQAAQAVKDVRGKDKITQKELDQVVEAEQTQKQIRERVGSQPDEGLRHELGKLQQMLRDNKMTDTEAQEKVAMLKGELDRLAQQELQQIEPQLAEARKDLAQAEKKQSAEKQPGSDNKAEKQPGDNKAEKQPGSDNKAEKQPGGDNQAEKQKKAEAEKKDGSSKEALERAARLQQEAQKAIDELVKSMAPWSSLQQIRAEAGDIYNKQKTLKEDLEQLQALKQESDKLPLTPGQREVEEKELKERMNEKAEQQDNLGKRMDDLVNTMREKQKERIKQDDKESARRLDEAAKLAEDNRLPAKLRDLARDMKDQAGPKQSTIQQQEKNLAKLEQMVEALEGKKKDVAERLQKKRRDAEKEMERLDNKLKDLERRLDQANKLPNEQERLQKRQELAKEHEQLKEELKKQARELARLQEQRASNDLNRAAEEADKAAKKLQKGENAADEQQNAQDQIQQARQEFQESEQELAREQLVQIADKLTGLKERQDSALERSEGFHKRLLARKLWTDELADTLGGDALSQRGLGKETASLKEKVKQAKVFEHILDRAANAMEEAAKAMEERKDEGLLERGDPKLAEAMKQEELDHQGKRQAETVRYQKQAARRLEILLDAIKQEIAKKDEAPKKQPGEQQPMGQPQDQEPQPKGRPGDGIPSLAQLKVLRAEQLDLNTQTKEFAERHPNAARLTDDQQKELRQIQEDQGRLMELFQQLFAPADNKGDAS
jgi:hypothetical protein